MCQCKKGEKKTKWEVVITERRMQHAERRRKGKDRAEEQNAEENLRQSDLAGSGFVFRVCIFSTILGIVHC